MNEFATIRRAYRYVVAYERRILDAMSRVDDAVRGAGFERNMPHRWSTLYRYFPSRDWAPDNWAWNHVPLYAARFSWKSGESNAAGSRYVFVDHIADTSFEEARLADAKGLEPDPLDGLEAADAARSILRWLVVELSSPLPPKTWNQPWERLLLTHFRCPSDELFPRTETPALLRRELAPLTTIACCADLASLDNPEALSSRFIEPLSAVLAPNG